MAIKLKFRLTFVNRSEVKTCDVETLYTDLYNYDLEVGEWDEDHMNMDWLEYLADEHLDTSDLHLQSYEILK